MIEIIREIKGAYDFELGKPRAAPLQYEIAWPQEGEAPGVVLVIPGFGGDTDGDYSRGLRRHIVETTGMGAVSVRYHAFHARPENGGKVQLAPRELTYLMGLAAKHGLKPGDYKDFNELAAKIARLEPDARPRAWIDPAQDEYQNFGVVQALDHLLVIGDLMENAPPFDIRRIVALGSSHGGYIAHMIAKIAPSTLAAVIDNSSYAQPPMNYLGIGEEPEVRVKLQGLVLDAWVRSGWTVSDRCAPNFYSRDRDLIRDQRYPPHLAAMRAAAADGGTQYFMVNASVDVVSPPQVKQRQQAELARAGFASELAIIGPGELDGRIFKTLTHGLDCSLKGLFDLYIGRVRRRGVDPDAVQGTVIAYEGVDLGYRFTHGADAPYVTGETFELHPLDQDTPAAAA